MDMEKMTATHTLIASDRVEGTPVRRMNGEKIGAIERVMIDKRNGNVAYAVLTFGGFLGIGQKHMPIPWSRLHYDAKLAAYQIDLSDRDLDSIKAGEDFDWGDRPIQVEMEGRHRIPGYWGAY
jgi:sporulation protein YlmC with PRC-barrel domain